MPAPALVIFHKQLGDVLLLEPGLMKLAKFSGTKVLLATRPAFAPMLSLIDHVLPLPDSTFRCASSVISFDPRSRACLQALTTRSPQKRLIVTAEKHLRGWHPLFFPTERRVADESSYYRAEYFFNLLPGPAEVEFRRPRLNRPPDTWLPENLPNTYVLIHTTSAWRNKSWPAASWAAVLDDLHAHGIGPFVATGGNEEWESSYVEEIRCATKAPLMNLSGKTALSGYLATVAKASMVLCIDGSAAHLAAAFRRPSITLFGPTHPVHWHYPADDSAMIDARAFSKEKRPSVAAIPVNEVVEAAVKLWGKFH